MWEKISKHPVWSSVVATLIAAAVIGAASWAVNSDDVPPNNNVNVSGGQAVVHQGTGDLIVHQGVSPETHAALAKELGVTEAALSNFFKILGERHVPPYELDAKLREIATRHKDLLAKVDAIPSADQDIVALKGQAQAAIAEGRYDEADALLEQAGQTDEAAAKKGLAEAQQRFLSAAATAAQRGDLAWTKFDFATAATHFDHAADLASSADPLKQANYLNRAGRALDEAGNYPQALARFQSSLTLRETALPKNHPDIAMSLNNLAMLYKDTNRLAEAEPLMQRAIKINEAAYGPDHPTEARDLNNLAMLYKDTNRLAEAEPLMQRAMKIDEAAYGPDHPEVARDLNNLAQLYKATNRLAEAEPLMQRAMKIDEAAYGLDHPTVAIRLNNLAQLYKATNRLAQAEPLLARSLSIDEAAYGPDHPRVAAGLNNLAMLYKDTNRRAEAEPLMVRAVKIMITSLGAEHPHTQLIRGNLEVLRAEMRK